MSTYARDTCEPNEGANLQKLFVFAVTATNYN